MSTDNFVAPGAPKTRPMGWLVGLGVLLITLGVVFGLIGISIVAKRKQRYRIDEPRPTQSTNPAVQADPVAGPAV